MGRVKVGGLVLFLLSIVAGLPAAAQAVTGVVGMGGSFVDNAEFGTDPAAVTLVTASLDPTVLKFTKDAGETPLTLTLIQINATAVAWDGFAYELEGGTFSAPPQTTLGGLPGMVDPDDPANAKLQLALPLGPPSFVDLFIDFDAGTDPVLTVTPLVPEPAAGALLLVTTPLLARRRRVRG